MQVCLGPIVLVCYATIFFLLHSKEYCCLEAACEAVTNLEHTNTWWAGQLG